MTWLRWEHQIKLEMNCETERFLFVDFTINSLVIFLRLVVANTELAVSCKVSCKVSILCLADYI